MKKISILLGILLPFCVTNVEAQEITKTFRKTVVNDNFSSDVEHWEKQSNGNEFYVIQEGVYVLHRKHKKDAAIIFPTLSKEFSGFHLKSDFQFERHKKGQSAGLIFMAQKGGTGALLVEINDKKEYRLRKLEDNKLRNLYYTPNDGWMKSDALVNDVFNTIEIKSYEKVYDLYFNGTYIRSFSDLEYKLGKVGIYVAPDTRVHVDNFKLFEEDILQDIIAENPGLDSADLEGEPLTQVIIQLNAKIKKLEDTIQQLNRELVITRQASALDSATQTKIAKLESKVNQQSAELRALKTQMERMTTELIELRNYKKNVEATGSGDIIESLSNAIEKEREKNKEKQEEINRLKEENRNLKSENRDLKTQVEQLGGGSEE